MPEFVSRANRCKWVGSLVVLACLHPLEGGFRTGLQFSEARPLTIKQRAALLADLRRWTGYSGIGADPAGALVLGERTRIAGGSAAARALISAAVDGPDSYIIESHQRSPEVAFARIRASLDYVNVKADGELRRRSWSVDLDLQDYQELRGPAEAISAFDPGLTLLHELAHAVLHLRDSASKADPLGDCERFMNQIRRELGLPERESYLPVNQATVTPYGTGQRLLGELTFVRTDRGNRVRKFRLTFDVGNVFDVCGKRS